MSRRSYLLSSQRIDLSQRRRTREAVQYSEQPVPVDIRRLPGTGGGGDGTVVLLDISWMSPSIGWMDTEWSWLS